MKIDDFFFVFFFSIMTNCCKFRFYKHSGQIFSFVQRSRGVVSHALVRSQFLLILTNQVPSLCLLPRFAAKLRPFLTVLTIILDSLAMSCSMVFQPSWSISGLLGVSKLLLFIILAAWF